MKRLFLFFTIVLSSLMFSSLKINATTREAYNIITNPSEDMSTSMHINYHSDISGTFVEYTLASDLEYKEKKQVSGVCNLWSRPNEEGKWTSIGFYERNVCQVELTDLEPDTLYRYRVGKNTFSEDFLFKTASEGSFSFVHLTDPQFDNKTNSQIFNNLLTKTLEINPDISFGLFSGDAVDKGGRADLWEMFFEASNIRKMPFAMTVGNHEYYDAGTNMTNNDYFTAHYFNPQNGPDRIKGSTYYFKYHNALFFVIDTELQISVPQVQWFKDVMNKEQAQYVIVSMHKSFYGSKYQSQSITIRSMWQRTFEEYGVDLVLSGHDHVYARSHLMYNNKVTDDLYQGITYIIGGSSGSKFYPLDTTISGNSKYYAKAIENTSVANIITVDEEKISLNLIDLNGNTLDSHTIYPKRTAHIRENFSKDQFMSQLKINQSTEDIRKLIVNWPASYGNVKKVKVNFENKSNEIYLATDKVTSLVTYLPIGKNLIPEVVVIFSDDEERKIEYPLGTKAPFGTIKNFIVDNITKTSARLTWEEELLNNQIEKYEIYVDGEKVSDVKVDVKEFTFMDLSPKSDYNVIFKAIDIYGDIVFEDQISFSTTKKGCLGANSVVFILPLLILFGFNKRKKSKEEE